MELFFQSRMADVIVGNEIIRVENLESENRDIVFKGTKPEHKEFNLGSAAAVSEHGYFLTAAHTVAGEDQIWLISKSRKKSYYGRARVIYLNEKQDVALLKIYMSPIKWFSIAADLPREGSIVVLGGHRGGCSAGKVLAVTRKQDGTDHFVEIQHSSPLVQGDSGGPLITPEGKLVGINHAWNTKHLGIKYKSTIATAIDGEWLKKVIDDDKKNAPIIRIK